MGEILRRPDLEAQVVSYPDYIGTKVFPFYGRPQISGTCYYQAYIADKAAQYGRNTAALADITSNVIAAADVTFACSEVRARAEMSYTQLKGYKDKEHADLAMGRIAKRAFYNKIEALIADKILNADDPVDGTTDIVSALDTAVGLVRDLGIGEVALVLSNHNKVLLKSNATIIERMKATGVPTGILTDVRNVGDIQLAAAIGCDKILTGKDAIWYSGLTGADKDNVAIVVLPGEEYIDPAEEVQLGRTIYFQWDDSAEDKFIMESWHNNVKDSEVVDAKGLAEIKLLNSNLCKTIRAFNNNSDSSSN